MTITIGAKMTKKKRWEIAGLVIIGFVAAFFTSISIGMVYWNTEITVLSVAIPLLFWYWFWCGVKDIRNNRI